FLLSYSWSTMGNRYSSTLGTFLSTTKHNVSTTLFNNRLSRDLKLNDTYTILDNRVVPTEENGTIWGLTLSLLSGNDTREGSETSWSRASYRSNVKFVNNVTEYNYENNNSISNEDAVFFSEAT